MIKHRAITVMILSYVVPIALIAVMLFRHSVKEDNMSWTKLCEVDVSAKPEGTWTWGYDYIQGPGLIKIEVEKVQGKDAKWNYSLDKDCTPDGDLNSMIACRNCIMPDAPVGALIAKIGGSTAGVKDGKLFLAGRTVIIPIDQSTSGPILLTINDELTGLADNSGTLKVKISIKLLPSTGLPSTGSGTTTQPASASLPVVGSGATIQPSSPQGASVLPALPPK